MQNTGKIFGANGSPSGKRALITGASSGLGLEFAELLAAQGVNLVLAARRREPMEKVASNLRQKYGVDIQVEPIDLAVPGAAAALKETLDQKALTINVLVNNAGYGLHGEFIETPLERTTDMIQLNITAVTELSYVFGRDMAARGTGEILLLPVSCRSKPFRPMQLTLQRRHTCCPSEKLSTMNCGQGVSSLPRSARAIRKRASTRPPALTFLPCCAG